MKFLMQVLLVVGISISPLFAGIGSALTSKAKILSISALKKRPLVNEMLDLIKNSSGISDMKTLFAEFSEEFEMCGDMLSLFKFSCSVYNLLVSEKSEKNRNAFLKIKPAFEAYLKQVARHLFELKVEKKDSSLVDQPEEEDAPFDLLCAFYGLDYQIVLSSACIGAEGLDDSHQNVHLHMNVLGVFLAAMAGVLPQQYYKKENAFEVISQASNQISMLQKKKFAVPAVVALFLAVGLYFKCKDSSSMVECRDNLVSKYC